MLKSLKMFVMFRFLLGVISIILPGCSSSPVVESLPQTPEPPYRALVAQWINKTFPDRRLYGEIIELSDLHAPGQWIRPSWTVCLRIDAENSKQDLARKRMLARTSGPDEGQSASKPVRTYALFMGKDSVSGTDVIMHARIAVVIDRCEERRFEYFEMSKHMPKPTIGRDETKAVVP
jgi:hypothetical protein